PADDLVDEVDARALHRRHRRRGASGLHPGAAGGCDRADDRLRGTRPGMCARRGAQRGARGKGYGGPFERLRLRRAQCGAGAPRRLTETKDAAPDGARRRFTRTEAQFCFGAFALATASNPAVKPLSEMSTFTVWSGAATGTTVTVATLPVLKPSMSSWVKPTRATQPTSAQKVKGKRLVLSLSTVMLSCWVRSVSRGTMIVAPATASPPSGSARRLISATGLSVSLSFRSW